MKEKQKDVLREIYQRMLEDNRISELAKENYCCMAPVVGKNYPKEQGKGFLFFGRATNDWEVGVNDTFDNIYNVPLDGLYTYIGKNKSAFFRVAGKVFSEYYGDDWFNNVAYSNLYKVAPNSGNPGTKICDYQWKYVADIFMKEIEILSPKIAVFFTNEDWGWKFLHYINNNENPQFLCSENWYKYRIDIYKIGDVYYLISEHPQGKPEQEHADARLRVIQDVKEGRL